jgi:hypothetical protein
MEGINDLSRNCGPSGFLDRISTYFDVYTRRYYYLERGLEHSLQLLTGASFTILHPFMEDKSLEHQSEKDIEQFKRCLLLHRRVIEQLIHIHIRQNHCEKQTQ